MGYCHEISRLHRARRFDRLNRVGRGGLDSARQVIAGFGFLTLAGVANPNPSRFTAGALLISAVCVLPQPNATQRGERGRQSLAARLLFSLFQRGFAVVSAKN